MYKLKNSVIILILVMLIIGSCKKSKKDISFTEKEYQAMGMPDHKKLWASEAYIQALTTLSNIRLNNPLSFPRKHSKKSGAVFNNFVNKENLSFLNDTNLSLSDKAHMIKYFPGFIKDLTRMYTDELRTEQYYDEELIETYIFGLFINEKMLELAGKIMNSTEETNINVQSGLQAVLYGYLNLIVKILEEQVKSNVYKAKDLDRLSMEVSHSLIKNMEWIKPVDRQAISIHIQNTIEKSSSGYIKSNYQKALQELN